VNAQRILQVSVAALVALGCMLMLLGHPGRMLPVLAIVAAAVSLLVTDVARWIRVPRLLGNLLALAAAVYSLSRFFDSDNYNQLLAIADLLVWLQIMLLFQEKNDRVYGELMVLSLLLVVVAAALEQRLTFGVLLGPYVAVGITALCAFFAHRETARFAVENRRAQRSTANADPSAAPFARWIHRLLGGGTTLRSQGASTNSPQGWSELARSRSRSPCGGPPEVYFAKRLEWLTAPLVGRKLLQQVAGLWVASVVFALAVFYVMPRATDSAWYGPGGGQGRVGFLPQVSFTDFRRVEQSDEPVMRVTFFDGSAREPHTMFDRPYTVFDEPYFRGGVLTKYSTEDRTWNTPETSRLRRVPIGRPLTAADSETVVRQEVVLNSRSVALLFAVFPAYANDDTPPVWYEPSSGRLVPTVNEQTISAGPYRYALDTTAFRGGLQSSAVPLDDALDASHDGRLDEAEKERLKYLEREHFPDLCRIAEEEIARGGIDSSDPVAVARTLEAHFHNRDRYTYSLDLAIVPRQPNVDPIEDFVAHHHTGHCEYFASALVLMLRSQGIPARLVVGYLGGDYNTVGHYWQVRQRDAHAWVEAYIEPQRAASLLGSDAPPNTGAWLRLDPTPTEVIGDPHAADESLWTRAGHALDYAELLWNDYVMRLNSSRQQNDIYSPLADAATAFGFFHSDAWKQGIAWATSWFGLEVLLAAALCCLALVGLWRLARTRRSGGRHQGAARKAERRREPPRIDYYRRLTALLARYGMRRETRQTPREFARAVAAQIESASPATAMESVSAVKPIGAERIPADIVEMYYGERYGGRPATPRHRDEMEAALDRLDRELEVSTLSAKARR